MNDVSGLEQNRDVDDYYMHPRYSPSTFEDDIALIIVRIRLFVHPNRPSSVAGMYV